MVEYHPLTMLTLDELKEIQDLSGLTLYKAETKRVPLLTPEEQHALLEEARQGSVEARNRVIMSCLALTIRMAEYKLYERKLKHSDIADLLGVANIKLLEQFPKALEKEDPLEYLMNEVMYAMKHYGIYQDPMIQRSRQVRLDPNHPVSVSFEAHKNNLATTLPAPDLQLGREEPQDPQLHEAIQQLTPIRRMAITRKYGLYGHPEEPVRDIARAEGVSKRSIDSAQLNARRALAKKLARK